MNCSNCGVELTANNAYEDKRSGGFLRHCKACNTLVKYVSILKGLTDGDLELRIESLKKKLELARQEKQRRIDAEQHANKTDSEIS